MGQKRDQNEPRKPMKRTGFKRKTAFKASHSPVKAQTVAEPSHESSKDYDAFMARFRGLPCAVCGREYNVFFGGKLVLTSGHHLLYRSTHPEYKMTKENIIPLCVKHHVPFAHEKPNEFKEWLEEHAPEQFEWMQEHNHHKNHEKQTRKKLR